MEARARIAALAGALALSFVTLVVAAPAGAEQAAWDQAKVTALAGELAAAAKAIRDEVRKAGDPNMGSMQSRAHHEFQDDLRLIHAESRHLASELAEGQGLDETLPVYRRLRMLIRDARDLSQRLYLQQPIQDALAAGRAKLDALAVYYPAEE